MTFKCSGFRLLGLLAALPMSFIGIAGVAKLIDIPAFAAGISQWSIVPDWSVPMVAIGVPAVEVATAGLWIVNSDSRRTAEWTAIALLGLFTLGLAIESAVAQPPTCSCFGLLARYVAHVSDAKIGIARNMVCIVLLIGHRSTAGRSRFAPQPEA